MKKETARFLRSAGLMAMIAGPILGIAAMIFAMRIEFKELEARMPPGDPSHVSKPIGYVLLFPLAGFGLGLAGWLAMRRSRKAG